ncbi:hypothetical protein DM02DRAFT_671372 [Periconia macrospinosa]|uniref:Uncharacterized protein n=1 Tax=Periconia macrospinosa TaxID=97972 RepID=A0A2V1DSM1_9PLEO|nr:hypothetical protein DM02DRAFT_671372 [Periconia macrospinosa]
MDADKRKIEAQLKGDRRAAEAFAERLRTGQYGAGITRASTEKVLGEILAEIRTLEEQLKKLESGPDSTILIWPFIFLLGLALMAIWIAIRGFSA